MDKHNKIIDQENRILYIDVLRIISILAVIIIHMTTSLNTRFGSIDMEWWWVGNFYNSIARWSVPIMVMVSGILLLDPNKEYPIKTFFKKRFNKVLIPFLFWGVIYTIWKYRHDVVEGGSMPLLAIIKSFIVGPVYFHLWFIYTILGLYLLTPVLRVYIKNATHNNIKYFLILWFVSTGIILFVKRLTNINPLIEVYFFSGFVGYYVLEYYLNDIYVEKKNRIIIYIVALISGISIIFGTYVLTQDKGKFVSAFNSYFSPNVIIMSIGIFIFIKNVN